MINEWIRNHKKVTIAISIGILALLALVIIIISNLAQNPNHGEEEHHKEVVTVSNIELLYNHFSDYTIGYITSAIQDAVNSNTSMRDGSPASEDKKPAADTTNEELYPLTGSGDYSIEVKGDSFDSFEDDWGIWNTFTITTNRNQTFKVDVALGAHNRENDVGYTKINITKL